MLTTLLKPARSAGPGALLGFAAATASAALAGGRATRRGMGWYEGLRKPPFQPPAWLFGPAWTLLYALIATSGSRVYRRPPGAARQRALGLWAAQFGLNGLWSWLFFAWRRPRAALVDSALLLGTAGAYVKVARRVDPAAARLFLPYVGWLAFATLLNEEMVRLNPTFPNGSFPNGPTRERPDV